MGNWIKITEIDQLDALKEKDLLLEYPLKNVAVENLEIEFPLHPVITSNLFQIAIIFPDPNVDGESPKYKQFIVQKVLPYEHAPIRYFPKDLLSGYWWKERP